MCQADNKQETRTDQHIKQKYLFKKIASWQNKRFNSIASKLNGQRQRQLIKPEEFHRSFTEFKPGSQRAGRKWTRLRHGGAARRERHSAALRNTALCLPPGRSAPRPQQRTKAAPRAAKQRSTRERGEIRRRRAGITEGEREPAPSSGEQSGSCGRDRGSRSGAAHSRLPPIPAESRALLLPAAGAALQPGRDSRTAGRMKGRGEARGSRRGSGTALGSAGGGRPVRTDLA